MAITQTGIQAWDCGTLQAAEALLRRAEHALGLSRGDLRRIRALVVVIPTPEPVAVVYAADGSILLTARGEEFPPDLGESSAAFITGGVESLDAEARALVARGLAELRADVSLMIDLRAPAVIALLTARRTPERHVLLFERRPPARPEWVH